MRPTALLLATLLVAGCFGEPIPPAPPAPTTHATDCRAATNATTCQGATALTPLRVATFPAGNRSKVGLVLHNEGDVPLVFDGAPPAFWVYARAPARYWHVVGFYAGGDAPGASLAPGTNMSVVLSYGKFSVEERARDIRYGEPVESFPWPPGSYRACWSAHQGDATEWVRGCKDFRIT